MLGHMNAILTNFYAPEKKSLLKGDNLKVLKFLHLIFHTTQYVWVIGERGKERKLG